MSDTRKPRDPFDFIGILTDVLGATNVASPKPFAFDDFLKAPHAPASVGTGSESFFDGDTFVIRVETPGVDPASIDVELVDGEVEVSFTREDPNPDSPRWRGQRGVTYGKISKSFALPLSEDEVSKVSASSKWGVLEIRVTRKVAKAKKIKIDVQDA